MRVAQPLFKIGDEFLAVDVIYGVSFSNRSKEHLDWLMGTGGEFGVIEERIPEGFDRRDYLRKRARDYNEVIE